MAAGDPLTVTYSTATAVGQRENLSSVISRIDPIETPGYSNYKKGEQTAIYHEWQEQLLAALDTSGDAEGADLDTAGGDYDAAIPTTRPGNYAQIMSRNWLVSGTLQQVEKAGRGEETVYQRTLSGLELRRNIEGKLHDNRIAAATDPRLLAGFITWITTGNWGSGIAAEAPVLTAGIPTTAAVIDTPEDIDATWWSAHLNPVLEEIYLNGGKPRMIMMTPKSKRQFSEAGTAGGPAPSRMSSAERNAATSFIGAIDHFESDYGGLQLTMNRFIPGAHLTNPVGDVPYTYESNFIIDMKQLKVVSIPSRSFLAEALPKSGDAFKGHVLWEGTLSPLAHLAHGFIASS